MEEKNDYISKMTTEEYNMVLVVMYNVIFANDTCTSYLYEVLEYLEKLPTYKKEIKYRANQLRKWIKKYNATLDKVTKASGFIADLNEMYAEELEGDIVRLEYTIKNYMNKCNVTDSELMSKCALADILAQNATWNLDNNLKFCKHISNYVKNMKKLRLTDVKDSWRILYKEIKKKYDKDDYYCDINDNLDINNGYAIIQNKLCSPQRIVDVIERYDNN